MDELLRRLGVNIDVAFYLVFYSLIWVRTLMMVSVVPFLFSKPTPRYAAVGIAAILAAFAFPNLVPKAPPSLDGRLSWLFILYFKEAFLGLTIGFSISIFFRAFESAGQMIDNQRGLSIARLLIPQLGEQGSITSFFIVQLGVVIFIASGGHLMFLENYFLSFDKLPIFSTPRMMTEGFLPTLGIFLRITGDVFLISLQLSAPIIISIFLADVILGMTNRFAPHINVWELGFNIKGPLGLLILFLALTSIAGEMQRYVKVGDATTWEVIKSLGQREIGPIEKEYPTTGLPGHQGGAPPVISIPDGERMPQ